MKKLVGILAGLGVCSSVYAAEVKLEVSCGRMPNGEVAGVFVNRSYYFSFGLPEDFNHDAYCKLIQEKTAMLNVTSSRPVEITVCSFYDWSHKTGEITIWAIATDGSSKNVSTEMKSLPTFESCISQTNVRTL